MPGGGNLTTLSVATASAALGVMPVFLTGALAVLVRQDFPLNHSQLGLVIACFFAASATFSVPGGALSDCLGPRRSLLLATTGSVVVLAAVASVPGHWTHLLGLMVLSGAVNGLSQPAANLALARTISSSRQGFAFGIKQSAVPGSTLLAGLSLPVVGAAFGWRGAFWAAAAIAAMLLAVTATYIRDPAGPRASRTAGQDVITTPRRALVLIALGGGLGTGAATNLGSFLVEAAVASDFSVQSAGLLLSVGSAVGIAGRLYSGWSADRYPRDQLQRVASMMVIGAVGFAILSLSGPRALIVIGTVLAFGAGWGWAGVYVYALVLLHPHAPGTASGIAQVGAATGAMLGPAAFGAIVEHFSFGAGWLAAAAAAAFAGACLLLSSRMVPRVKLSVSPLPTPTSLKPTALACGPKMNGDAG
ncbi:MAG: MFS transporter [Actinomycetota bacterium]